MHRAVLVLFSTLLFAAIGFYLGYMLHGTSWRTVVTTTSGGLGGFAIAFLGSDLWRKHRSIRQQAKA